MANKEFPNNDIPFNNDNYQRIMVYLSLGSRSPQNETEQRILDEINTAKAKGQMMDLPFE